MAQTAVCLLVTVGMWLAMASWVEAGRRCPLRRAANSPRKAVPPPPTPPDASTSRPAGAPKKESPPARLSLFDGRTLDGWKESGFATQGRTEVRDGTIVISVAEGCNGLTWTKEFPKVDYEIRLEAQRVDGQDFFCGLTFPVERAGGKVEPCTLIVGGWGGGVVGLSSIDGHDASENSTSTFKEFENGRWYKIRLRVTRQKIEAWIDEEKLVDFTVGRHELSVRIEVDRSRPLGIATWHTTAALRNLVVQKVDQPDTPPNPDEL